MKSCKIFTFYDKSQKGLKVFSFSEKLNLTIISDKSQKGLKVGQAISDIPTFMQDKSQKGLKVWNQYMSTFPTFYMINPKRDWKSDKTLFQSTKINITL